MVQCQFLSFGSMIIFVLFSDVLHFRNLKIEWWMILFWFSWCKLIWICRIFVTRGRIKDEVKHNTHLSERHLYLMLGSEGAVVSHHLSPFHLCPWFISATLTLIRICNTHFDLCLPGMRPAWYYPCQKALWCGGRLLSKAKQHVREISIENGMHPLQNQACLFANLWKTTLIYIWIYSGVLWFCSFLCTINSNRKLFDSDCLQYPVFFLIIGTDLSAAAMLTY
jgi:hypothetical protein